MINNNDNCINSNNNNNNDISQASVKSSNLSGSIDGPDGWVETLMQVAVCEEVSFFTIHSTTKPLVDVEKQRILIFRSCLLCGID